jgi:hypothetical protein
VVYFIGKADDDHGLTSLNFHYQILKSEDDSRKGKSYNVLIKFDNTATKTNFFYLWPLKALGVLPGEEITYYFDVADNDGVYGPKILNKKCNLQLNRQRISKRRLRN